MGGGALAANFDRFREALLVPGAEKKRNADRKEVEVEPLYEHKCGCGAVARDCEVPRKAS